VRTLYALANSTATLPVVSRDLIQRLARSLGDDTLKLLASVWISHSSSSASSSRYAALRHANAYLEAHFSAGRFIDFQVIVPALLIAVGSAEQRLREAALDCITVLARLSQAKKPESVYAFDAMYGLKSGMLSTLSSTPLFLLTARISCVRIFGLGGFLQIYSGVAPVPATSPNRFQLSLNPTSAAFDSSEDGS
jgi:U3 small nucleolar RNA-associated protein 10